MEQIQSALPFILMFVVIFFFMILPQQKRAKKEKGPLGQLVTKEGIDEVNTFAQTG